MLVNLTWNFVTGSPVYPFVNWKTVGGYFAAIFIFLFIFLMLNCARWCTMCKARSYGYDDLYDALADECECCTCCCCKKN